MVNTIIESDILSMSLLKYMDYRVATTTVNLTQVLYRRLISQDVKRNYHYVFHSLNINIYKSIDRIEVFQCNFWRFSRYIDFYFSWLKRVSITVCRQFILRDIIKAGSIVSRTQTMGQDPYLDLILDSNLNRTMAGKSSKK